MRIGAHDGYSRLVFDLPSGASGILTQDGTMLTLRFTVAGVPAVPAGLPSNARFVTASDGAVEIGLAPGVRVRRMRLPDRLVLDLLDSPTTEATPSAAVPPAATERPPPTAARPGPDPSSPLDRHRSILASRPEAVPLAAWTASSTGPRAPAVPAPVAATPLPAASAGMGPKGDADTAAGGVELEADAVAPVSGALSTLRLPFGPQTGAAAFRLGDEAMLVFDERRPIDMARLRDNPNFAGITVQLLARGTLIRFPLDRNRAVGLSRSSGSWNVAIGAENRAIQPIRPGFIDGELHLPAVAPGQVLAVPNPLTGGELLVGTQRAPGQRVVVARRNPTLNLLATWQGVALDPDTDALVMRIDKDGFVVTADRPAQKLPLADGRADGGANGSPIGADEAGAMAEASVLTRRFDFPALPPQALIWRLRTAIADAAATPAQSRGRARLGVAQAMVALGLGAEAQAVLGVAAADDPRLADDPDLIGLSAIAALLAGRPAEAAGLDDPRLSGTDEIALWRAVRTASGASAPDIAGEIPTHLPGVVAAAGPVFAADIGLLRAYPAPLRARLLPLAAETMAAGGEAAAAARLLASRPQDRTLDLARAMMAANDSAGGGDPTHALALYDSIAAGNDRLSRLRAAVAATELRLHLGQITADQAANQMERLITAWRGDGRELAIRLRTAELRRQAGEWRRGLATLRETARIWPDQGPAIRARLADMFAAAIADDRAHKLPALEFVSLVEENPDLVPQSDSGRDGGRQLAERVADRLAALDLPARAITALAGLMASTPPGPARAALGQRLAAWQLQNRDAAAALATLDNSGSEEEPDDLGATRRLLRARADAGQGDPQAAMTLLDGIDTAEADELRAGLLEASHDWPAATEALTRYALRTIPAEGALDSAQGHTLLRLASAAAQAGDEKLLARLRDQDASRMPTGDIARLFTVLTEPPVRDPEDLPRAAREAASARGVPAALKTLSAPASPSLSPSPHPAPSAQIPPGSFIPPRPDQPLQPPPPPRPIASR